MSVSRLSGCSLGLLVLAVFLPGCKLLSEQGPVLDAAPQPPQTSSTGPKLVPVVYSGSPATGAAAGKLESLPASGGAFPKASELSVDGLVREVLARNPTLAQRVAAWKAAEARYPQVTSLDDPLFGAQVAPRAFGSNEVQGGYRLEVSQKYPFCGKRALRGENALAEAHAAGNEVEETRLQLIESARSAFCDYYLVERALEINRDNLDLLRKFRETAKSRYENNLVPQQDVLQADVEIGKQQEREVNLEQVREVTVARTNTLLHLPPDSPLPPPPRDLFQHAGVLTGAAAPPETRLLREAALAHRPDLKALADRIAAEQAALGLAQKEFCPDVEVMAAYDTFWQEKQLQAQLGVRVNLPVRLARRCGAVAEAQARLAQRQAELDRQIDQVNFQVQEAAAQVRESSRIVRLYNDTILKAAREHVEAARAAYSSGQIPFLTLVEAQRNQVNLRDRYYEAVAALGRRLAMLERVIGGLPEAPHPKDRP